MYDNQHLILTQSRVIIVKYRTKVITKKTAKNYHQEIALRFPSEIQVQISA